MKPNSNATEYSLIRHSDGLELGKCIITPVQLARYLEMVQHPQCTIRLSELPRRFYKLKEQYSETQGDVAVFLE